MLKSAVVCLIYSQHRLFFLWMHCIGSALNKDSSVLDDYVTEMFTSDSIHVCTRAVCFHYRY